MTQTTTATCGLCGRPMPEGEEMFRYHGHSGPCPSEAEQVDSETAGIVALSEAAQGEFVHYFGRMQQAAYENSVAHGWHEEPNMEDGTRIALMHSELSEALEGLRDGNPPSEKIGEAGFTQVEEEFADVIIRILDMAGMKGYRIAEAVVAKHAYNLTRPHRHGGRAF